MDQPPGAAADLRQGWPFWQCDKYKLSEAKSFTRPRLLTIAVASVFDHSFDRIAVAIDAVRRKRILPLLSTLMCARVDTPVAFSSHPRLPSRKRVAQSST